MPRLLQFALRSTVPDALYVTMNTICLKQTFRRFFFLQKIEYAKTESTALRKHFDGWKSRKKQKTGGKSNQEKQKRKVVLVGAHKQQAANRKRRQRQRNNPKHQRGRASRGAWD